MENSNTEQAADGAKKVTEHLGRVSSGRASKWLAVAPSMKGDSVGNLTNAKGSSERDQTVPRVWSTEEVGPRKKNGLLKSWQGATALTSKDWVLQ